ncbi:hypothetical protein [Virgibacillus halodenitrificans]|uniref:hypothetical protein n=1 Tax=Virgibacillus halodenitrificans TaxID=1482 RepID=UPI0013CF15CE|nr:hypothetical protein [Virgibacillus halodenitrificans]
MLRTVAWLKDEKSQISNESGMHNIGVILLVIGIMALLFPAIKMGFDSIMQKFTTTAATSDVQVSDPLGSAGDWAF